MACLGRVILRGQKRKGICRMWVPDKEGIVMDADGWGCFFDESNDESEKNEIQEGILEKHDFLMDC